jgi:hypothetical protein
LTNLGNWLNRFSLWARAKALVQDCVVLADKGAFFADFDGP